MTVENTINLKIWNHKKSKNLKKSQNYKKFEINLKIREYLKNSSVLKLIFDKNSTSNLISLQTIQTLKYWVFNGKKNLFKKIGKFRKISLKFEKNQNNR